MVLYENDVQQASESLPPPGTQANTDPSFGSKDLQEAMTLLPLEQHTLVLCWGDRRITDTRRGIRPLLELLESSASFAPFSAADKVVGKAAAFLYLLLDVKEVYAQVISQPALQVLNDRGIPTYYSTLVPAIRNRTDTGFCPMETAVWDITDPQDALLRLKATLQSLST